MTSEIPVANQHPEVKEAITTARASLRDAYSKGADKAVQLKDAALERAGRYKDVALDKGRSAMSMIEQTIEERPFTVIGGVFLGGLIIGFLMRRK